jgi:hypothetical protein
MNELISAYNNTKYTVYSPIITIQIGVNNSELDELLKKFNITSWAYVTAFNPFSKVLSKKENLEKHDELKEKVKGYKFYEGEGVGEDASWEPETSLLIMGISKKESIELGIYFEQNAIVVGAINGLAELKILV